MWLLTLKSLLVSTDLTDGSMPALRTAARLAPLAGAELHLLHVSNVPLPNGEERLREQLRDAAPGGPAATTARVIVAASVVPEIAAHAARVAADAILIGPHARGADGGGEMGSTADGVVRTALCPCLVVRDELRLPLSRVLVPLDLEDDGDATLSIAMSWASALRPPGKTARLTALHVARTAAAAEAATPRLTSQLTLAREEAGDAAHVSFGEEIAVSNDAAAEIVRRAMHHDADLLVMGTRRAAAAAPVVGSVAAAVIRSAPPALLMVPPQAPPLRGA